MLPGRILSGQWATYTSLFTSKPVPSSIIGLIISLHVNGGTVDSRMTRLPFRRYGRIDFRAAITNERSAIFFLLSKGVGTAMRKTSPSQGVS
jgi:hypothetical protein